MELTDEQWAELCELAGLDLDTATAGEAIAKLRSLIEASDDAPDTETVDAATLTELQALAADGMRWREHERTEDARRLVQAACDVGKISAASRERWFNYVLADPDDAKLRLERIKAGTIPRIELGRDQVEADFFERPENERPGWVR